MAKKVYELKRIEPVTFAVVLSMVSALLAFLLALLAALTGVSLAPLVGTLALASTALIVILPISYFIATFLSALTLAIIYNFVAAKFRGIKIVLK